MVNGNELMTKIYMVPIIITNVKIMYHAVLPAAIVSCFTTFFHRRTINFNELKIIVWGGGDKCFRCLFSDFSAIHYIAPILVLTLATSVAGFTLLDDKHYYYIIPLPLPLSHGSIVRFTTISARGIWLI